MTSFSDLFTRNTRLLDEAFYIDRSGHLVVKSSPKSREVDEVLRGFFVESMRGILSELVLPQKKRRPYEFSDDLSLGPQFIVPGETTRTVTSGGPAQTAPTSDGPQAAPTSDGPQAAPNKTPYGTGERLPAGSVQTPQGPALPSKSPSGGDTGGDQNVSLQSLRSLASQPPSVINQYLRTNGIDYNSAAGNYCMALANAYQHSIGRPGTGSLVATSVLRYGTQVDPKQASSGDVGVVTYGHGYGETGGHAVTIVGAARPNPQTGELEVPVLSSHGLGAPTGQGPAEEWRPVAGMEIHRWTPNGTNIAQVQTNIATPQNAPKTGPVDYTPGNFTKSMGITPDQYNAFRQGVAGIENANYNQMGGSSNRFAGRYQMGGDEIAETARRLREQPPSTQQFLRDPQMQERYFEAYTLGHHETLMNNPKYANASPEQKLQILGYAHNQGATGASNWLNTGQGGKDNFGTAATKYSDTIGKNLAQLGQSPSPVGQSTSQGPTQVASLDPSVPMRNTNSKPLPIGDSLAVGVGNIYGNTQYAHGGWNPQRVSGLVDQAIKDGSVKGRPVVLSGGASNAGGDSQMVSQYYPQMIQKLKDAGASSVHVLGVGPYSHYDNYGYNKIIGDATKQAGVNFTGPLANVAPFSGTDLNGGVHPNDYRPIVNHIQQQLSAPPPANVASASPGSSSTSQVASASPPPSSSNSAPNPSGSSPSGSSSPSSSSSSSGSPSPLASAAPPAPKPTVVASADPYQTRGQTTESYRRPVIQLLRPYK